MGISPHFLPSTIRVGSGNRVYLRHSHCVLWAPFKLALESIPMTRKKHSKSTRSQTGNDGVGLVITTAFVYIVPLDRTAFNHPKPPSTMSFPPPAGLCIVEILSIPVLIFQIGCRVNEETYSRVATSSITSKLGLGDMRRLMIHIQLYFALITIWASCVHRPIPCRQTERPFVIIAKPRQDVPLFRKNRFRFWRSRQAKIFILKPDTITAT